MKHNTFFSYLFAATALCSLVACSDDVTPPGPDQPQEPETKYVGQAVGNFKADEWYPGGQLGTTENVNTGCYEDNTPAIETARIAQSFQPRRYDGKCQIHAEHTSLQGLGTYCFTPFMRILPRWRLCTWTQSR